MKLMFLGDRIFGGTSAYTKVGYETCTRLADMGHAVAHTPVGKVNLMGKQVYKNIMIYPSGQDYFAEDVAVSNYIDFKADMLITIKDPWVFNEIFKWAINFVPMAVIDHQPISQAITGRLATAFKVIAISRMGQMELQREKISSVYIPHGVRTDIYRPLENKEDCRKRFFLNPNPDVFTVGVVAMNRARKMIPRMLRGYKRFIENNPDIKTQMMLWTNVQPRKPLEDITIGASDAGVWLIPEIIRLGLNEKVHWPKWSDVQKIGGLPEIDPRGGYDMVHLYNCFDVNLLCSGGEGAGLPYLEAAACGIYSVGTRYAAAPEYVGPGITVPYYDYDILSLSGSRLALADIDKMAEALAKIANGNPEKMKKKARAHAERYSWDKIMKDYWEPFLAECEAELRPKWENGKVTTWN